MMEKGLSCLSLEVSILVSWLVAGGAVLSPTVPLISTLPMTQNPLADPPLSDLFPEHQAPNTLISQMLYVYRAQLLS